MDKYSSYTRNLLAQFADRRYVEMPPRSEGLLAIDRCKARFPLHRNIIHRYYPPNHLQRYMLVVDRFRELLDGKILDVGARENELGEIIKKEVSLVDKYNPRLGRFDWEKENLPFGDESFDTLVCLDTLEHIDDIHGSLEDLMRVARRNLIISLPNNWRRMVRPFTAGRGYSLAYGIPPEKPRDRHKWFFNTEHIEDFIFYRAGLSGEWEVSRLFYYVPVTTFYHRIVYPLVRVLFPERYFKNFLVHTVFIGLTKK